MCEKYNSQLYTLGSLIERLEKEDPNIVLKLGWEACSSYRGYYEHLALYLSPNQKIGDMLKILKKALGSTQTGYKGGHFVMDKYVNCYLINDSSDWDCEPIGSLLLDYMLKDRGEI